MKSLTDLWEADIKHAKMHILGAPIEGEIEKGKVRIFEEIIAAKSQIDGKCSSTHPRSSTKSSWIHSKRSIPRNIIITLLKLDNLEGSTRVVSLPFKGSAVRSTADFPRTRGGQMAGR